MLKINNNNLWDNEEKILDKIQLGEEFQVRKKIIVKIGSMINHRYRNINTDFFKAAQALLVYILTKWGSLADKPVIKIKLNPYLAVQVYVPMSNDNYISIYQDPTTKKIVITAIGIQQKKFPLPTLVQLYETLEDLENVTPG